MGAQLYTHVLEFERQWLRDTVRATLYRLVVPCLCAGPDDVGNTSANERRISGELFLQGVQNAWADHNVCMAMLSDVLMYMVNMPSAGRDERRLTGAGPHILLRTGLPARLQRGHVDVARHCACAD